MTDQLEKRRIDIQNHRTVEILDKYNRMMFIDLEREARAIQNWQKLRVLLAILKICGNRFDKYENILKEEKQKRRTVSDVLLLHIRDPTSRAMNLWFIIMSLIYYIGLIQDSLQLANMYFLLMPGWRLFTIFRALMMLIDIILTFFTAIPKSEKQSSDDKKFDNQKLRKKER